MSWSLALGDRIGVELPFIVPPELMVSLELSVEFPDADPMGIYVFPSLYYELYGPGIDSTPRLVNQDSTAGGIINIDVGSTKMRVYLRYDAKPGPLGTLPHGDIRRSRLTIKAATGFSVPTLGTRVHELILDSSSTRITMLEGTVLGVPYIADYVDLEPMLAVETFVSLGTNANYWTKFVLTEPPVSDLSLRVTNYLNGAMTHPVATRSGSGTTASFVGSNRYDHILEPSGNGQVFAQDANGVLTKVTTLVITDTQQRLVPAGTKALFHYGSLSLALHDAFMANIATYPEGHSYFRYHLESYGYTPSHRGKNWRIPLYTFIDAFFAGKDVTQAPWHGEVSNYEPA